MDLRKNIKGMVVNGVLVILFLLVYGEVLRGSWFVNEEFVWMYFKFGE